MVAVVCHPCDWRIAILAVHMDALQTPVVEPSCTGRICSMDGSVKLVGREKEREGDEDCLQCRICTS